MSDEYREVLQWMKAPMSDECRFGSSGYCITHAIVDPISGRYPTGADPTLCTHAAAALRALADEAEEYDYRRYQGDTGDVIAALQAKVEELEAMWAAKSEVGDARIAELEATIDELRIKDAEWARMLLEQTEHGLDLTITAGRLRKALGKAADTFADFHAALHMLRRFTLAEAARIAEEEVRASISG